MILLSGLPYYPASDFEYGRSRIFFMMIIRLRPKTKRPIRYISNFMLYDYMLFQKSSRCKSVSLQNTFLN